MSEQQTKEEEGERGWERMMTWRIHIQPQPSRIEESELIVCMDDVYICVYMKQTRSATEWWLWCCVFLYVCEYGWDAV